VEPDSGLGLLVEESATEKSVNKRNRRPSSLDKGKGEWAIASGGALREP